MASASRGAQHLASAAGLTMSLSCPSAGGWSLDCCFWDRVSCVRKTGCGFKRCTFHCALNTTQTSRRLKPGGFTLQLQEWPEACTSPQTKKQWGMVSHLRYLWVLSEAPSVQAHSPNFSPGTPTTVDARIQQMKCECQSLLPLYHRYMLIMFHGYLHELVGGLIGIGPRVRTDMFIHHVATMTLISSAYLLNLSRMGIMWQALFDISNPLLHAAKMMNTLKFPQVCVCVCARGWEHVFCL
eukprot:118767-Pelagomonas_calceolata.AAC.2